MAWIYLLLAGVFEIVWATAMKESAGFTRLWPSLVTLLFMILSFGLLAVSMKTLPLGTAYTIWVGIGAVGAFALGILLFGESPSSLRLLAVGLIVAGIVILKLATWALLAYLFGALALCLLMLGLGRVLGGRSHGRAKNLPFESGVDSTGSSRLRFSVKYALVAMLFVIFGIEMPFLYLWAVSLRENGWAGFVEATLFVSLLLVGLFYLHRVGALDWSPERRRKKPHD